MLHNTITTQTIYIIHFLTEHYTFIIKQIVLQLT